MPRRCSSAATAGCTSSPRATTGGVALYRFPARLQSGAAMKLERVRAAASGKPDAEARITDGAVSPDGQHVVLRTNSALTGFSRLYLGQHYASDVVAGVIAGAAWVAVCASALEVARRRRPALP